MLGALVLLYVCQFVVPEPHLHQKNTDDVTGDVRMKGPDDLHEDAKLKVPGLVRKYGYPLEEHQITTKDGYILTMHRIPHGRENHNNTTDRPVILIMHGLLSSSADWVLMGPNKGFAYILAEEGFDVWLGNARGNRYSRRHVSLNPDSETTFWQFSWDEIGNIDLPAMIDYVLERTGKRRLHYIGHSQGTTSFFVMCSLRPEYNQKIISMNALAPVAYMAYSGNALLRSMAPLSSALDPATKLIGTGEMYPNSSIMRWAGEKLCSDQAITQVLCTNLLFLFGGWNSEEFNTTMLPVIFGHTPAGASVRQFIHYGQNIVGKEFRRYSYGKWNTKVYGTSKAPLYDLSKVTAPVFLKYSLSDPLAHVKDVERLSNELGNVKAKYIIPMSTFSHLDYIWGIHAKKLVYEQVISNIKTMQANDVQS